MVRKAELPTPALPERRINRPLSTNCPKTEAIREAVDQQIKTILPMILAQNTEEAYALAAQMARATTEDLNATKRIELKEYFLASIKRLGIKL